MLDKLFNKLNKRYFNNPDADELLLHKVGAIVGGFTGFVVGVYISSLVGEQEPKTETEDEYFNDER